VRVLGIDPGSRIMGYGVVEERKGQLFHLGHGVIRVEPSMRLEHRLHLLFQGLCAAVERYRPDSVAVEGVFACRNMRSALILGHARGIALLVAAQTGIPVREYSPAAIKRSVGAGGAAGKDAVARMVSRFLQVARPVRADASDALATAICHLNHSRAVSQASASGTGARRREAFASLSHRLTPAYHRAQGPV